MCVCMCVCVCVFVIPGECGESDPGAEKTQVQCLLHL